MTELTTRTRCLVCGEPEPAELLDGRLRRCPLCGFGWTVAGADADLYVDDYFGGDQYGPSEGYEDYFRPAARRYEAQQRLRWLAPHGPLGPLLEVGSAGGFFVEAATRAGIAATGVDVAERAVRYARDALGVPVTLGPFEHVPLTPRVQTIGAFHVLEHVEDPRQFLRLARRRLLPGGLLALEVPNFASAAAGRSGVAWPGLQLRYHRWHFSPDALTRLVVEHGFEVITTDTTTFRHLMPAGYRRRHPRLAWADLRATGTLRRVQRRRGDLLRLLARRQERP